jgi:hypothetical protein
MPPVLFLVANKFSGDGNVSSADVDANFDTLTKTLNLVKVEMAQRGLKIVIRLHVVLPGGANR